MGVEGFIAVYLALALVAWLPISRAMWDLSSGFDDKDRAEIALMGLVASLVLWWALCFVFVMRPVLRKVMP